MYDSPEYYQIALIIGRLLCDVTLIKRRQNVGPLSRMTFNVDGATRDKPGWAGTEGVFLKQKGGSIVHVQ